MAQNANNVSVGKPNAAGGIYTGALSSPVPTDATSPLSPVIEALGYVGDSGLVNSISTEVESIKAWGGDTVLTVRTSREETFQFTLIESLNPAVLRTVYGPSNVEVDGDTDIVVLHNAADLPNQVWVFEILLTGDRVKRIVVPSGKVTEVGDVTYVDGEPVGFETTISALPDQFGNTAYEYIAQIVDPEDPEG